MTGPVTGRADARWAARIGPADVGPENGRGQEPVNRIEDRDPARVSFDEYERTDSAMAG